MVTWVQIWRYDADIGVEQVFSASRVILSAPLRAHTSAHARMDQTTLCMKMAAPPSVPRAGSSQMLVSSFFRSSSSCETDSSSGGSSRQPSTVNDSEEERGNSDGVPPNSDERAVPPSKRYRQRDRTD